MSRFSVERVPAKPYSARIVGNRSTGELDGERRSRRTTCVTVARQLSRDQCLSQGDLSRALVEASETEIPQPRAHYSPRFSVRIMASTYGVGRCGCRVASSTGPTGSGRRARRGRLAVARARSIFFRRVSSRRRPSRERLQRGRARCPARRARRRGRALGRRRGPFRPPRASRGFVLRRGARARRDPAELAARLLDAVRAQYKATEYDECVVAVGGGGDAAVRRPAATKRAPRCAVAANSAQVAGEFNAAMRSRRRRRRPQRGAQAAEADTEAARPRPRRAPSPCGTDSSLRSASRTCATCACATDAPAPSAIPNFQTVHLTSPWTPCLTRLSDAGGDAPGVEGEGDGRRRRRRRRRFSAAGSPRRRARRGWSAAGSRPWWICGSSFRPKNTWTRRPSPAAHRR